MARLPRSAAVAPLLLILVACSRGPEPEGWTHLAAGYEPRPVEGELTAGDGHAIAVRPGAGDGLLLSLVIAEDDWVGTPVPGLMRAPVPLGPSGFPGDTPFEPRLAGDEDWAFTYVETGKGRIDPADYGRGAFTLAGGDVFLVVGDDGAPPRSARFEMIVDRGRTENGRWRVPIGTLTADGIPVLPGFPEEVRVDAPAGSVLRLATAATARRPGGRVVFRAELDGEVLFEATQEVGVATTTVRRVVPLPAGGVEGGRLALSVEGDACLAAFVTPVVGPAEVGDYRARPWGEDPPDVVLFVADTFRADYMALYGGKLDLTPFLDRFADECLVFERTWANATWTLPGHGSIFSGLQPAQHTATTKDSALPREVATLTEHFLAHGYRTAAVTDGLFVTRAHGLDQGFEWFDEGRHHELEQKIDAALDLVAADDGRPLFLFVHTYETHMPYDVSERTREEYGDRFDFSDLDGKELRFYRLSKAVPDGEHATPELEDAVEQFKPILFGTVIDLDRGFERFVGALRRRGFLDGAALVFTSDHGEAMLEHDGFGLGNGIGHGEAVWEEFVRIPLLIHGPGVSAGRRSVSASQVDLPRTIADLAGLRPDPRWGGASLLDLDGDADDRPVFTFALPHDPDRATLGVIDGRHKLILPMSGDAVAARRVLHAYDLTLDPGEQTPPLEGAPPPGWADEVLDRTAQGVLEALQAAVEAEALELTPEQRADLEKLGYF